MAEDYFAGVEEYLYELEGLAAAFLATGNPVVRNHLRAIADGIKYEVKQIKKERDDAIQARFEHAQESSVNLLKACLAAPEIAEKMKKTGE